MLSNSKKKYFILLSSIFIFSAAMPVAGALEIQYPTIDGVTPNALTENILPQYVRYIFTFGISIAGLIAFGSVVYGGIRHATSAGNPSQASEGNKQISAGVLGLVFLMGSYILLTTINPQLVIFKISITRPPQLAIDLPGVYLSEDGQKWFPFPNSESFLEKLNDKARQMQIKNPEVWNPDAINPLDGSKGDFVPGGDYTFVAVLHEDANWQGQCKLFLDAADPTTIQGKNDWGNVNGPSSISVLRKKNTGNPSIKLCDRTDGQGNCRYFNSSSITFVEEYLNDKVRSAVIDGNAVAVLFEHSLTDDKFPGKCQIITKSESDLKDSPINKCNPQCLFGFFCSYSPCTSAVVIFPTL